MKATKKDLDNFETALSKVIVRYCKKHKIDISEVERRVKDWNPESVQFFHNDRLLFTARLKFTVEFKYAR